MKALSCVAVIGLAACAYHPPAATDVSAKPYQTDLAACRETAHTTVNKQNAKRGLDWFSSPVRRWGQIRSATQSCMVGRGYGTLRWCSADELKSGTRSGTVVVTAEGVQCSDPPTPARRKPVT